MAILTVIAGLRRGMPRLYVEECFIRTYERLILAGGLPRRKHVPWNREFSRQNRRFHP
jgi:hypothetical protein